MVCGNLILFSNNLKMDNSIFFISLGDWLDCYIQFIGISRIKWVNNVFNTIVFIKLYFFV